MSQTNTNWLLSSRSIDSCEFKPKRINNYWRNQKGDKTRVSTFFKIYKSVKPRVFYRDNGRGCMRAWQGLSGKILVVFWDCQPLWAISGGKDDEGWERQSGTVFGVWGSLQTVIRNEDISSRSLDETWWTMEMNSCLKRCRLDLWGMNQIFEMGLGGYFVEFGPSAKAGPIRLES